MTKCPVIHRHCQTSHTRRKPIPQFPVAQGDLVVSLITSDYARLRWCQARTNTEWKDLLGPGSKDGLDPVIKGSLAPEVALQSAVRSYAAEDLLEKLVTDLGPDIVKELMVDRIYLEHALCKVMRLS